MLFRSFWANNQDGSQVRLAVAEGLERLKRDEARWLSAINDGMRGEDASFAPIGEVAFHNTTGGDWGARMGREYFMDSLGQDNIQIYLHEIGHTFGLDDFYDWTPTGITNFLMLAGSASEITDFDGWMLRNWWYELSRDRGW